MVSAVDELSALLYGPELPPDAIPPPNLERDPELEARIASAKTKVHRALELGRASYIYADRKQFELALETMELARATSPRTVLQRVVDKMQMRCAFEAAMERLSARMEAGLAAQRREREARRGRVPPKGRGRKRNG